MRRFIIFTVAAAAVVVAALYATGGRVNVYFFERTEPSVDAAALPQSVGSSAREVSLGLADAGAGLSEVVVRLSQGGKEKELARKAYGPGVKNDTLRFTLDAKTAELREGEAELSVRAFDRSFWNTKAERVYSVKVDYTKPKIEVLTVQHNGTAAGALTVFYSVTGKTVTDTGVRGGAADGSPSEFPGYPAGLFDPSLSPYDSVYVGLFPITADFDAKKGAFEVYAVDQSGNRAVASFYQKIQGKKFKDAKMAMPREFFVRSVDDLLPKFLRETGQGGGPVEAASMSDEELAGAFRKVNEDYRKFLNRKISEATSRVTTERLWSGAFQKPMPSAPTATFGERREYFLGSVPAGRSVHWGIDLAQTQNTLVRAANGGKVVYAEDLGIYGNTVIVDHGFGLVSLYGHLSSLLTDVGAAVKTGDPLGKSGMTGLAGGDHLHFEIRLAGVPVSPFEWLDSHWIGDHVDRPIRQVADLMKGRTSPSA